MLQLPKLSTKSLDLLKAEKNLLAFSAGTDSTALFFILKALHVEFDIALVNYKTRPQSDKEEEYAKELAKKYNLRVYTSTCKLDSSNFEKSAREARYAFFEETIEKHSYTNLLTAHHLNDRLEWFLMQLSRGAGTVELSGMSEVEKQENYTKIRPLLNCPKEEILEFLKLNKIKHFLDSSNTNKKYFRNQIREEFANSFCSQFSNGIKRSFNYLEEDSKRLLPQVDKQIKELFMLKRDSDDLINIRGIDRVIKKLGLLLSGSQREEIIRTKDCIISSKIAVSFSEELIYICPMVKITMDKKFKERCRIAKIPSKIRPYMYRENISIL